LLRGIERAGARQVSSRNSVGEETPSSADECDHGSIQRYPGQRSPAGRRDEAELPVAVQIKNAKADLPVAFCF
jgi:hypothetical protein